ncbi:hypothetical protein PIB30_094097 [Stylosanthes scabra]|uniref:Zinc finger GRF-type domain-containing protein n=1 Tax=Stylosanthes scabra TaxID=79078 RepID=A0ABU6WTP2_9FABA|nr:hypothetical protein [Stylosanthes scabra]
MKCNVKSRNKGGVEGGNQGKKKVKTSKTFSASSGKILKSGIETPIGTKDSSKEGRVVAMAAQNSWCSRSSRSTARTQSRMILCDHGEQAVLRVSGTKENPGRRFYSCVYDVAPKAGSESLNFQNRNSLQIVPNQLWEFHANLEKVSQSLKPVKNTEYGTRVVLPRN